MTIQTKSNSNLINAAKGWLEDLKSEFLIPVEAAMLLLRLHTLSSILLLFYVISLFNYCQSPEISPQTTRISSCLEKKKNTEPKLYYSR